MGKKTDRLEQGEGMNTHPDPERWWRNILYQSYAALGAMIAQVPLMLIYGLPNAAAGPLVVLNLGLVAVAATYSGGCTLIDAIKAWRGNG